jgi:hypothetical protein
MIYNLPQVNINNVEDSLPYSSYKNSLEHYIHTFRLQTETTLQLKEITQYTPENDNFFVMLELLQLNNISNSTNIISLGSNSCIEAFEWLKNKKSLKIKTYTTQLIVADIDDFKEEVLFALNHQTPNGICMLKIVDTNKYSNIQLIYFLCACYKNVHLCKPKSIHNSLVKYIICSDFKEKLNIDHYENIIMPYYFLTKINELNAIYSQIYFNQIYYNYDIKEQLIQWCSEFFIPI